MSTLRYRVISLAGINIGTDHYDVNDIVVLTPGGAKYFLLNKQIALASEQAAVGTPPDGPNEDDVEIDIQVNNASKTVSLTKLREMFPDIQGPKGDTGSQGPKGDKGEKGDKGDVGRGIELKGAVDTSSNLPREAEDGEVYLAKDTGHGWARSEGQWVDVGPFRGPQGVQGPKGDKGDKGEQVDPNDPRLAQMVANAAAYAAAAATSATQVDDALAGAVRADIVQTLTAQAQAMARGNIGLNPIALSAGDDLNDFTNGFYNTTSPAVANVPDTTHFWYVSARKQAQFDDYSLQVAVAQNGASTWSRVCQGGVWTAWRQIVYSDNPVLSGVGNNGPVVLVNDTSPIAVGVGGSIGFQARGGLPNPVTYAQIKAYARNGTANQESGDLQIITHRNGVDAPWGSFMYDGRLRFGAATSGADLVPHTSGTITFPSVTGTLVVSDSPTFTGTPTAPTPPINDSSNNIATTLWYIRQLANADPLMDGVANTGTAFHAARQDHVHPTDTSRAPKDNPAFTGNMTISGYLALGSTGFLTTPTLAMVQANHHSGTNSFAGNRFSDDIYGGAIQLTKSRSATIGTQAAVLNGDILGGIYFSGSDGTNYLTSAQVLANVDGTPSAGIVPARISFSTMNASGVLSNRMIIKSDGQVGIGASPEIYTALTVGGTYPSASSNSQVVRVGGSFPSTATGTAWGYLSAPTTQSVSFTLNSLRHFSAEPQAFGAGSVVNNQAGFYVASSLTGAVNNFGFYGNIPDGNGRWNFYGPGTAPNFFAGSVGIGANASAGQSLRVSKDLTGASSPGSVLSIATVQSDAVSVPVSFLSQLNTAAGSYTVAQLNHYRVNEGTKGAGSTITSQYGYLCNDLTIGNNNYGFCGLVSAGTGKWNFYAAGTARNWFGGNVGIAANGYLNFSQTDGISGYGIRDNAGVIESKSAGGEWGPISALSFSPVQQGTGVGQQSNIVKIGWSDSVSTLKATVDNTDLGKIWIDNLAPSNNGATSGFQRLPSGLIIQWGSTVATTDANGYASITLPTTFPTQCTTVLVSNGDSNAVSTAVVTVWAKSNSGVSVRWLKLDGGGVLASWSCRTNWLAIGY